jgi:hypothetical protein
MKSLTVRVGVAIALLLGTGLARSGRANAAAAPADIPQRPAIMFNRWQEDWSVLADPQVPRKPFDELKYIPLSSNDPKKYLSLGADLRERFEANDATGFGTGSNGSEEYVISRLEAHADLHLGSEIEIFTQLESAFAPGKVMLTPVDRDRADLEQAFVALTESLGGGTLKLRIGRQQFAFDLQRFVSARDGPNVRQSYDAVWLDYETGPWRLISFYSQPVQNRDLSAFDDYSSGQLTYGGVRVERKLSESSSVAIYYSRFNQDSAQFLAARGNELRDIVDIRFTGATAGFDWDVEAMNQTGRVGTQSVEAWAFGTLGNYTLSGLEMSPQFGLQIDGASGDNNAHDHQLGTFNPLFPNGYYLTLAGYTGYVNFIHVKPSLTLHPADGLKIMFAGAAQWRETTADAVYTQPDIPVAATAGHPGRYTGTYGQIRTDFALNRSSSIALEFVHFAVGEVIQRAGGHDSNYLGIEYKCGW